MGGTFGYHGRVLDIACRGREAEARLIPLPDRVLRSYIGGVGLGTALLASGSPSGIGADPLSESACLVIALSPLVGTPLTTSAKFAVVGFGPLTGRVCDALSSSHFAIAAKRSGVDAIRITGRFESPSVVFVDGNRRNEPAVSVESAGDGWGKPAREFEDWLRSVRGNDWQVLAIGPAGEALVPFANISHDGRHAGRGGLGAILGSKYIKAIAVRGDNRVQVADPARTVALAKSLSARSMGPETEKYREVGTVANLLVFNRFDALPTRNFQSGSFAEAEQLAGSRLGPTERVGKASCASCTIGCEHLFAQKDGKGRRVEYESLYALGPLCGISDPDAVVAASALCDELGLDTITTGATAAFLMECAERGWIDGGPLRFGDGPGLIEAIRSIPGRQGIGELLAMGSRRASLHLGGDAPNIAPHVKGLEMPGYDPRALQTMALGLAVGTRGADHNRSGAYEADFSGQVDRRRGGEESAGKAIESEDRAALMDSLILCKFVRGVFQDFHEESAELLQAVTGWDVTGDELRQTARRIVNARKWLNIREGWTRAEDTLPGRLLADGPDDPNSTVLTRDRLDRMIDAYYVGRGWSADGLLPDDEVEGLIPENASGSPLTYS